MSAHNYRHAGDPLKWPVGNNTVVREGCLQKLASNLVCPVTDGVPGVGIALESLTCGAGDTGTVELKTEGVFIGKAANAVNFGWGDAIYPTGSEVEWPTGSGRYVTEFDAGAQGNISAGYVVEEDPAASGFFKFRLNSTIFTNTTHA